MAPINSNIVQVPDFFGEIQVRLRILDILPKNLPNQIGIYHRLAGRTWGGRRLLAKVTLAVVGGKGVVWWVEGSVGTRRGSSELS